ncbi:hypothetical protein BRM19_21880 [Xanthomonas oryzae pv. oryzae]|nr:hypothetical protein BRM19_21880 [Xanthomonas oryzae pv. oryzae]
MTTSRKTTTRNRAPDMPKGPHEVERRAYLQQMLDEGFHPADGFATTRGNSASRSCATERGL